MTSRAMAAATATVLLTVAAACSSGGGESDAPSLRIARSDGSEVESTFPDVELGSSLVVPLQTLCTTGDPVKIDKVVALRPTGGMRVTSWGTRYVGPATNDGPNKGGITGSVDQVQGFGHHAVRVDCGNTSVDEANQFSVSVAARNQRATMHGVTIYYAHGRTLKAQYTVAMCSTTTCADAQP